MTTRRRSRRTEQRPLGRALLRGAVVLAILGVLALVALRAPGGLPLVHYRTAFVTLPDIGDLQVHDDVRIAGVRVGQVLATQTKAGQVRLEVQFAPGTGAIPADSNVVVRSSGLLGQRYLQIVPGPGQTALADGGILRPARLPITLGIPEALQVFDTATRGGLHTAVNALGAGLVGRGPQLNEALSLAPRAATDFRAVAEAVLARPTATKSLIGSLDSAASALDAASGPITDLLRPMTQGLRPFVERRTSLQSTLAAAPATLTTASGALQRSLTLLSSVGQLATAANTTLPSAPVALRATSALLRDSPVPLVAARDLLGQAQTAVPATLHITRALSPVLPRLQQPLQGLITPIGTLTAHDCDIVNFAHVWASMLGFGVAGGGGGGQIGPLGEIRAEAILPQPLAESGTAFNPGPTIVHNDPYPAPCKYSNSVYSLINPLQSNGH